MTKLAYVAEHVQQGLWVITQALEFVSQVVVCVFH